MRTCNGCDRLSTSLSVEDGAWVCRCIPDENDYSKARSLGWWDIDEGVPTPDWCPKEAENA